MSMTFWAMRRRKKKREADEAERKAKREAREIKDIDEMKVSELKAYAKEKGIDLGGAEKKSEILAVIKAV